MNCIFGTGGFARELEWLLANLRADGDTRFDAVHFVAEDSSAMVGSVLKGFPVIGEGEFYARYAQLDANCFIAVSAPLLKQKIATRLRAGARVTLPAVIDPSVAYDRRPDSVRFGAGAVVCARVVIEPDVEVEEFVHINMACTVGHETRIGARSTLSPGAHIAGNVSIGSDVYIGSGAVVLEQLTICPGAVIGAGAVVVADIVAPGTYLGVPARRRVAAA